MAYNRQIGNGLAIIAVAPDLAEHEWLMDVNDNCSGNLFAGKIMEEVDKLHGPDVTMTQVKTQFRSLERRLLEKPYKSLAEMQQYYAGILDGNPKMMAMMVAHMVKVLHIDVKDWFEWDNYAFCVEQTAELLTEERFAQLRRKGDVHLLAALLVTTASIIATNEIQSDENPDADPVEFVITIVSVQKDIINWIRGLLMRTLMRVLVDEEEDEDGSSEEEEEKEEKEKDGEGEGEKKADNDNGGVTPYGTIIMKDMDPANIIDGSRRRSGQSVAPR